MSKEGSFIYSIFTFHGWDGNRNSTGIGRVALPFVTTRRIISALVSYNSTVSMGLSSFFIKPDLKIIYEPQARTDENIRQTLDHRWGPTIVEVKRYGQPTSYPERRFLNVIVENKGKAPAMNCEARLRLLTRINDCHWLSKEEKSLCWENGKVKVNIGAKYGRAIFNLAFSQKYLSKEQLDLVSPVYCGVIKEKVKPIAWVATCKALENPEYRDQDGLCQGNFKVHVEVVTEKGQRKSSDFVIRVGDRWEKLDAEKLECKCYDC